MLDLDQIIKKIIARTEHGEKPITLLAVCPNSTAVLEAAVKAAAKHESLMLFAATLNQVDYESSYTGWTQNDFVSQMNAYAQKYRWSGPLYPCLDHGGPWLKDQHTLEKLSYDETMGKVKASITECIRAGYRLLHIDPTIDRSYPANQELPLEIVVDRTVELIVHAECIRIALGLPKVSYEAGTEEVHGGLVDISRFESLLGLLKDKLLSENLFGCWPCLFVAQIGTNLHTTQFQPEAARRLYTILAPFGSLVKGHYTDWVDRPAEYPSAGIGAANVGPEFTAEEFSALRELEKKELLTLKNGRAERSDFINTLRNVVVESGRWKKWLLPDEEGRNFSELSAPRREWLLKTGSRYIWRDEQVITSREILYHNLSNDTFDPNGYVVDRIMSVVEKYISAFNLERSISSLGI